MTDVEVDRYLGDAAASRLSVVQGIYGEVYAEPLFDKHPFFRFSDFAPRYVRTTGESEFGLLIARKAEMVVGCIYGYALGSDTHWWDGIEWSEKVSRDIPSDFCLEDGSRTVVITQLMVRRPYRRGGVARVLHDEFLAGRREHRAALRVLPDNAPAVSAYTAWGWTRYGLVRPAPEAPTFECFVRDIT